MEKAKEGNIIVITDLGNEIDGFLPRGMLNKEFKVEESDYLFAVVRYQGMLEGVYHNQYRIIQ